MDQNKHRENHVTNVIFLLLPIILLTTGLVFATRLFFNKYFKNNSIVLFATNKQYDYSDDETLPPRVDFVYTEPVTETVSPETTSAPDTTSAPETGSAPSTRVPPTTVAAGERKVIAKLETPTEPKLTYTSEDFPTIYYGTCWAVLNVEGWWIRNVNVYFGDTETELAKGAGMWFGSSFCGKNGKTVISGHVMSHFYSLESTKPGAKVTMTTSYGTYIYEVDEVIVFHETDSAILRDTGEGDVLFLYTCYPRSVGLNHTETRCALKCKLIEGCVYEKYLR